MRTTTRNLDRAARLTITTEVRRVCGEWQLYHGSAVETIHASIHPTREAAVAAMAAYVTAQSFEKRRKLEARRRASRMAVLSRS